MMWKKRYVQGLHEVKKLIFGIDVQWGLFYTRHPGVLPNTEMIL